MLRICVIGLGYIGLPTAVLLASCGQEVTGVDTNSRLLKLLGEGKVQINEPDLQPLIINCLSGQTLKLRSTPEQADVFIITVPTPYGEDKSCELGSVIEAVKSIISCLDPGNLIIVESTVPPGTCEEKVMPLLATAGFKIGEDIHLAFCPERVLPGQILKELVENSRVIGGYTATCARMAAEVYRVFVRSEIILTNLRTAEMVKLVENAYRDVNIALANEFTVICNQLAINALDVIRMANQHPRVNILHPGPGVGGHCLAVDPYFIVQKAPEQARLVSMARIVNENMPFYVAAQVKLLLNRIENPGVAVFGISYKGNVADLRESPAVKIVHLLKQEGFQVVVFDPLVPSSEDLNDVEAVVRDKDMILILADHDAFKFNDYEKLVKIMRNPIIFDTRNFIDSEQFGSASVRFYNLGNIYAARQS